MYPHYIYENEKYFLFIPSKNSKIEIEDNIGILYQENNDNTTTRLKHGNLKDVIEYFNKTKSEYEMISSLTGEKIILVKIDKKEYEFINNYLEHSNSNLIIKFNNKKIVDFV